VRRTPLSVAVAVRKALQTCQLSDVWNDAECNHCHDRIQNESAVSQYWQRYVNTALIQSGTRSQWPHINRVTWSYFGDRRPQQSYKHEQTNRNYIVHWYNEWLLCRQTDRQTDRSTTDFVKELWRSWTDPEQASMWTTSLLLLARSQCNPASDVASTVWSSMCFFLVPLVVPRPTSFLLLHCPSLWRPPSFARSSSVSCSIYSSMNSNIRKISKIVLIHSWDVFIIHKSSSHQRPYQQVRIKADTMITWWLNALNTIWTNHHQDIMLQVKGRCIQLQPVGTHQRSDVKMALWQETWSPWRHKPWICVIPQRDLVDINLSLGLHWESQPAEAGLMDIAVTQDLSQHCETCMCMYVCMKHANLLSSVHDKSLQGRWTEQKRNVGLQH